MLLDKVKTSGLIKNATALVFLVAVVGSVLVGFYSGYFQQSLPIGYDGDSLYILGNLQAAHEGGIKPLLPIVVDRLNAPMEAEWSDFPMSEYVFWLPSLLVPWIGVFEAANAFVLISLLAAGLAFYFSACAMGASRITACVFGILFALLPYGFVRNIEHLMLTIYFVVPVYIYCAWRLWGLEGTNLGRRELLWLCVLALVCSLFMPYYWAMFLVLLSFVALGHVANLSLKGVGICAVVGLAACLGFVIQNIDTFWFRLAEGPNPEAFGRDLWWMVKFGLYLPDMILPKFHLYEPWEQWAGKNYHWKIPVPIQGESQTAYIGIVALVGLAILIFWGLARASAGKLPNQPALFWFAVVVFGFAVVGGVNYLLGAFGFQLLRASNRYSLFLAAIGLFYLAIFLTKWNLRPVFLAGICALILPLGIYDQIPKIPEWQKNLRDQASARFLMDREFFPEMERRLPEGAMVFQFPVHPFPEMGPVHEMGDYEHFRPYLHTKDLRFSYGTVKGRRGSEWQAALLGKSPEDIRAELVEKGFRHVLINRRAYGDRGEELKNQLVATGMGEIMGNSDFFILEIEGKEG
jgi:phosphoglycerol transferase